MQIVGKVIPRETAIGYDIAMTTIDLRRKIKKTIDRLPPKQLASVDDFVQFLNRRPLAERLSAAQTAIARGKGTNWRKVRSDV